MTELSEIANRLVRIHDYVTESEEMTWSQYYFTENALRKRVEHIDKECEKLGIACEHDELKPKNKSWQYIGKED